MTSEAFILYRNVLPSSYLENYISFQAHFSLKELILALEHSGWWVQCSTKRQVSKQWRTYCCLILLYPVLQFYFFLAGFPQSYFASLAPLPLLTSSQLSILALSLIHRQPEFPSITSMTWFSQTPLNWWYVHSPALSHKVACKRCSRSLCCLTKPRSASKLGSMILYTYHHSTKQERIRTGD